MSKQWEINPETGDYVMRNGSPIESRSLTLPAYYRLKTHRRGWLYAPDDNFGSDMYLLRKRRTQRDVNIVESAASRALQPMVDDGRASRIDVTAIVSTRNAVGLETKILDAQGEPEQLVLTKIGV